MQEARVGNSSRRRLKLVSGFKFQVLKDGHFRSSVRSAMFIVQNRNFDSKLRQERHVKPIICGSYGAVLILQVSGSINISLLTELQARICANILSIATGSLSNPSRIPSASSPIGGSIVSSRI